MSYQLPVSIEVMTIRKPNIFIQYPQLVGLTNSQAQRKINQQIVLTIEQMMKIQAKFQQASRHEVTGHFEIKTNERGIFCVQMSNYAISQPAAHGYTVLKSLTFSLKTGTAYELRDLFLPDENYVFVLSKLVQEQIKSRSIPLIHPFQSIQPNQDYYLADKSLVIYFPLFELAPYYYGFPMFPISIYEISEMAVPDGPLGTLAADIS